MVIKLGSKTRQGQKYIYILGAFQIPIIEKEFDQLALKNKMECQIPLLFIKV